MNLSDLRWKARSVSAHGICIDGYVRSFDLIEDCDVFFEMNLASVVSEGGCFFRHLTLPPKEEVRIPGVPGVVGYRFSSPIAHEVWYIPRCQLGEILEVISFFGFPSNEYANNADVLMGRMKTLLLGFHKGKKITVTGINASHLMFELVRPEDSLSKEDALMFLQFNEKEFGFHERKSEQMDKIQNWIQKRFFTIGAI